MYRKTQEHAPSRGNFPCLELWLDGIKDVNLGSGVDHPFYQVILEGLFIDKAGVRHTCRKPDSLRQTVTIDTSVAPTNQHTLTGLGLS